MSVHSVSIAKYRLKNLLAADRMHCTADLTEQMKNDLYHAVSKYTEINPAYFSIDITRSRYTYKIHGRRSLKFLINHIKQQYHIKDYKFGLIIFSSCNFCHRYHDGRKC